MKRSAQYHSGAKGETALFRLAGVLAPAAHAWLRRLDDTERARLTKRLVDLFLLLSSPTPRRAQKRAVRLFGAVLFRTMARARRRGDDALWRWGSDLMAAIGRSRAAVWAEQMGIDPSRMDELARLQDREDELFGVTGHWQTRGPNEAVKIETACPFAACASEMPELCTEVVHRFEVETFRTLNPAYRLAPLDEPLLSSGGESCRFVHRLKP